MGQLRTTFSMRGAYPQSFCLLCFLVFGCTSLALAEEVPKTATLTPAQLLQDVDGLRAEIEQIRLTIGKRLPRSREFKLAKVSTRQVYFQAQTLFRKCNRLAQEVAGVSRQAPKAAPEGEITKSDVHEIIQASRAQLQFAKEMLGIQEAVEPSRLQRRASQADVMHGIIEAGYVLNRLISEQPDWTSIYDRVVQMITYVSGDFPEEDRYPALPAYECCKMPQDVYAELTAILTTARPLARQVNLEFIEIIPGKQAEGGASTATVYDLTTTMVSDLAELTLRMNVVEVSAPSYEQPPRIFPSHVLQVTKVLNEQIRRLAVSVD